MALQRHIKRTKKTINCSYIFITFLTLYSLKEYLNSIFLINICFFNFFWTNLKKLPISKYRDIFETQKLICEIIMKKRKNLSYEQKLIGALKKLPNPLEDKKHNILIFIDDSRARSNQSRFEHIVDPKHKLLVSDIERIARCINASKLKTDRNRKDTFNFISKEIPIMKNTLKYL